MPRVNMPKPVAYLAIDPGDMSGWAHWDAGGNLLAYGQVPEADYNRWLQKELENEHLVKVICENYLNSAYKPISMHVSKRNRSNKTSKKIGALEALCELKDISYVLVPNTNIKIGSMWSGFPIPSNHSISHQFVAIAHGTYWLVQNNVKNLADALKKVTE